MLESMRSLRTFLNIFVVQTTNVPFLIFKEYFHSVVYSNLKRMSQMTIIYFAVGFLCTVGDCHWSKSHKYNQ